LTYCGNIVYIESTSYSLLHDAYCNSSPPVFSGVRVTRYLVLCVCFVDHCLSICALSFGHCVVCSSSSLAEHLKV